MWIASIIALFVAVVVSFVLLYWGSACQGVEPVAFWLPLAELQTNGLLSGARRMMPGGSALRGAESVTLGPDGYMYAGVRDGWIVRFDPNGDGEVEK